MKFRPVISSSLFTLCLLLVIAVIAPHSSVALYEVKKGKDDTKATQAPSGVKEPLPAATSPAQTAATKGATHPSATPRNSGKAGTRESNESETGQAPASQSSSVPTEESNRSSQSATSSRASASPTVSPPVNQPPEESWLDSILYWGIRALGVLGVLLVLGLIGYGVKQLIDGSRARTEAYFAGMKRRQDEHASKTREALVTLNNRMAELQSEIRDLRRSLQDDNRAILDGVRRAGASSAAYAGSSSGYAAQSPRFEKEEPAFPAAAEDYLNRNRRSAVVVKPDFQNGILVQDAEGQGEFMLVRDHSAPDELLYVIPRTGYFQTKQDFLTYYAKYYECARPSAGTVWIVQPAVVDRVSGGWSLREKGELEVR